MPSFSLSETFKVIDCHIRLSKEEQYKLISLCTEGTVLIAIGLVTWRVNRGVLNRFTHQIPHAGAELIPDQAPLYDDLQEELDRIQADLLTRYSTLR